jgi:prepilin-type N-terminal cleavage/methylation domain-containing protein
VLVAMKATGRRRSRGFTMIELMIVLVVMGIVAAAAAPSFREYTSRSRLRGVAAEAYSDLQYARSESVQRYRAVRITFSSTGYVVDVPATGETLRSVTFGNGITGTGAMVATFDPIRGQATVTDAPTTLATTGSTAQARLNVNAIGRPLVCSVTGVLGGMKSC